MKLSVKLVLKIIIVLKLLVGSHNAEGRVGQLLNTDNIFEDSCIIETTAEKLAQDKDQTVICTNSQCHVFHPL